MATKKRTTKKAAPKKTTKKARAKKPAAMKYVSALDAEAQVLADSNEPMITKE